jgi:putative ABC transport system substrate-binding protein
MRRRELITLLGGGAAWPLVARAQRPERMRRIGVLQGNSESDSEWQLLTAAFVRSLQKVRMDGGRQYDDRLSMGR